MISYADFLAGKQRRIGEHGHHVDSSAIHPRLHDWQRDVVQWAVLKGRAALWEECGLGKTFQSLEWARLSADHTLIVAPLGVSAQTVREAAKLDLDATYVRSGERVTRPGIWVTNYEMVHHFDPDLFGAVVLDEASILKDHTGRTRSQLITHFERVPRRLECTATPAPNDAEELTNHAEFLGVCSRTDMLSTYFVHDADGWKVKGHAQEPMYDWMSTWAMALRSPTDLGYPDEDYQLPGLDIIPELLPVRVSQDGQLFATDLGGVGGRAAIRRQTLAARCERAAELVDKEPGKPWLLWCGLNDEATRLTDLIPDAVNVHGAMPPDEKTELLLAFSDGEINTLVSKPSVAGHGMNWQHCADMSFVGMDDSFEKFYQAVRRCLRYGQKRRVRAHLVLSELESQIAENVIRKEQDAERRRAGLVAAMRRARLEMAA